MTLESSHKSYNLSKLYDFVGTDTHHQRHLAFLEKITHKKALKLVSPILGNNVLLL